MPIKNESTKLSDKLSGTKCSMPSEESVSQPKPKPKKKATEHSDGDILKRLTALESAKSPKKERAKRVLSDDQKQLLRDRLVKAREVRQAKRSYLAP